MGQIINVCIVKKDESAEYSGTIDVEGAQGINVKCSYILTRQDDKSKHLSGEFVSQYPVLSHIINKLDTVINTI